MTFTRADTRADTHTKTDIRKVFECFYADLRMLVTRTRAMPLDKANNVAHDVSIFAESGCLASVHIQLYDSNGYRTDVHEYTPQKTLMGSGARPGGNSWPYQPNGRLRVILSYSNIPAANRIKSDGNLLRLSWMKSGLSTDYSDMQMSDSRQYASNGCGLARKTYRK